MSMDLRIDPLQARLAEAVDTALTRTGDVYAELAALGVPGLGAPQSLGGLGLGLSADIMVNARLGHGLEPLGAYRETVLVLELLEETGVAEPLLEEVLKGQRHAATAGVHTDTGLRVDAEGRLWGDSEHLPVGDFGLVVARATAHDGTTRPYVVTPDPTTCAVETGSLLRLPTVRLRFSGARAEALDLPAERWSRALDAARVRQAAVLLGLADRALAVARSHVNRRVQYGSPLVNLQTVSHGLARLVGEADGWRLLLHEVAWHRDQGRGNPADAARLLAVAAEHALLCTRKALQLHGVRGMLAHSTAATAYRLASVEAARTGAPAVLWARATPHPAATGLTSFR
jgi:alkylation response protein AidB-like acyl-CoA dehydrogenase